MQLEFEISAEFFHVLPSVIVIWADDRRGLFLAWLCFSLTLATP